MIFNFILIFLRVGIDLPKVEVRYEHLNVEGEAYLASKALPSFTKFYTTVFEVALLFKSRVIILLVSRIKS